MFFDLSIRAGELEIAIVIPMFKARLMVSRALIASNFPYARFIAPDVCHATDLWFSSSR
ncbi:hypothetical protein H6F76_16170 [Leptolyngbya sp. FACHB-321]|uniref:hypothetical protein n=1 Tax=Leptolyngbya sp. FACHB-321 TaxID=2692807 RepID=UPI001687BA11|nr:hypothetical protein [Leptolyngbya sp. FACHB-321]MBD2036549.1 hypothetical protein [Leptolyngbya sp. FACHB-321]